MTERSGGVDRGGPGYVYTFRLPCAQYAITFLRRRFGVKAVGEKNPSPPTFHSVILPPPASLKAETDNIRCSTISFSIPRRASTPLRFGNGIFTKNKMVKFTFYPPRRPKYLKYGCSSTSK